MSSGVEKYNHPIIHNPTISIKTQIPGAKIFIIHCDLFDNKWDTPN